MPMIARVMMGAAMYQCSNDEVPKAARTEDESGTSEPDVIRLLTDPTSNFSWSKERYISSRVGDRAETRHDLEAGFRLAEDNMWDALTIETVRILATTPYFSHGGGVILGTSRRKVWIAILEGSVS